MLASPGGRAAGKQESEQVSAKQRVIADIPNFAAVAKKVMPAVVSVAVAVKPGQASNDEEMGLPLFDELLRKFFERYGEKGMPDRSRSRRLAQGSGFIIDPEGYVVTDDHVIAGASRIAVILQGGTRYPAHVVGHDTLTDLALLKIDAGQPLPYVSWGNSDAMQVADWVLAFGNQFSLGGAAILGIVSARGRDIRSNPYEDFLQIDAALNLGSSGGPAVNADGEVIGVSTAIYAASGGSVGIGFAIPANLARPVIAQLKARGKVDRGWIGVQVQEVAPDIAVTLGLPRVAGALVSDVPKDSPAASAGIKQGDVILAFDGREILEAHELPRLVADVSAGQTRKLRLWRNGRTMSLEATIEPMPEKTRRAAKEMEEERLPEEVAVLGLKLAAVDDYWRKQLDLPKEVGGALVTEVSEESPLVDLDLRAGDVIQSINRRAVSTPQHAAELLRQAQSAGRNTLLLINRQGVSHYAALTNKDKRGGKLDNG
jgi:serine protease Do